MDIRFHLWLGGRFGSIAITGLLIGAFTVTYGATPGAAMAELLSNLPAWLLNPWFKLALIPIGLFIIWASLTYNIWSQRRKIVDDLAEELSWAINDLLNRTIHNDADLDHLDVDFKKWGEKVTRKIGDNKAFFSKADRIHFERLGRVQKFKWNDSYCASTTDGRHDHIRNMLSLKLDRLRDIINWTQMRTR